MKKVQKPKQKAEMGTILRITLLSFYFEHC
jgi:hypothetical protein